MLLPIAPRPYSKEIMSSWIARVGTRYDMSASEIRNAIRNDLLVDHYEIDSDMGNGIDYHLNKSEIKALSKATRTPLARVRSLAIGNKSPKIPADWISHQWAEDIVNKKLVRTGKSSWSFCRHCLVEDMDNGNDMYIRRNWILGCYGYCHLHQSPLRQRCLNCNTDHTLTFSTDRDTCRLICENCLHEQHIATSKRTSWLDTDPRHRHGSKYIKRSQKRIIEFENDLFRALNGRRVSDIWLGPTTPNEFLSAVQDHLYLLTANFRTVYPIDHLINYFSYYGFRNHKNYSTYIDIPFPAAHVRPSRRRSLFAALLSSFGTTNGKEYFFDTAALPTTSINEPMDFIWSQVIENEKLNIRMMSKNWPINLRARFENFT